MARSRTRCEVFWIAPLSPSKPITPEIAGLATQFFGDYPRDPVDRLIGATARAEGLALVTRNESIRNSSLLRTIW